MKDISRHRLLDAIESLTDDEASVKSCRIDCFSSEADKAALIATIQEHIQKRDACVEEYGLIVFLVEV